MIIMNISKTCRLCRSQLDSAVSMNLFSHKNIQYLQQVETITNLKLNHGKEYPQKICGRCKLDLELAYQFRERCIRTDLYIKEALESKLFQEDVCFENDLHPVIDLPNIKTISEEINLFSENKVSPLKSSLQADLIIKESISNDENSLEEFLSNEEVSVPKEEESSKDDTLNENPLATKAVDKPRKILKTKKRRDYLSTKAKTKAINQDSSLKVFICDQCGNNFQKRHHFIAHLRRHSGDKQYPCELCSNKFFTQSELNRHMRRHTGERPFACRHCQRRFTDYSTRIKHERTHTNERPFACNQCGKAFTTSYILKNHLLTHSGERSFKCSICNKSFQRQTHLAMHFQSGQHKQNEEKYKNLQRGQDIN